MLTRAEVAACAQTDASALKMGMEADWLAREPLWIKTDHPLSPTRDVFWTKLQSDLRRFGHHWQLWIEWYEKVLAGSPIHVRVNSESESWEAAFTDVRGSFPWKSPLPWDDGPEAVDNAVKVRLDALQKTTRVEIISRPVATRFGPRRKRPKQSNKTSPRSS
jgi:hypothetical protein